MTWRGEAPKTRRSTRFCNEIAITNIKKKPGGLKFFGKGPAGDLAGGHFGGHGVRNFWNRGLLRFVALRVGNIPALAAALRPDGLPAAKMLPPVLQLDGSQK